MSISRILVLCCLLGTTHIQAASPVRNVGTELCSELGCVYCHTDVRAPSKLRELTPDLSTAGLRYNPGYLFEYFQNPVRVRQHIGRARMPNFHLTPKETLALVRFLETQKTIPGEWPGLPDAVKALSSRQDHRHLASSELASFKTETTVCLGCHTLGGNGGHRA